MPWWPTSITALAGCHREATLFSQSMKSHDTPWFEQRDKAGTGGRGVAHAAVVGISRYPYVSDGDPDLRTGYEDFGRKQLSGAATSAFSFARWLRDRYQNPDAPIATIRLLLAPSAPELDADAGLGEATQHTPQATAEEVIKILAAWRRECLDDPTTIAILYACGHGVAVGEEWPLLLTEDFARGPESLNGSINIRSIHRQMWGGARRLVFFLDCCRMARVGVERLDDYGHGRHLGEPLSAEDRCPDSAPVFCSTGMGQEAFVGQGGGTVFSRALQQCLDNDALVRRNGKWVITTNSLQTALREATNREAAKIGIGIRQVPDVLSPNADALLHVGNNWPDAQVSIELDPDEAKRAVTCVMRPHGQGTPTLPVPFIPNPYVATVRAGCYTVRATTQSPWFGKTLDVDAKPPYPESQIVDVRRR